VHLQDPGESVATRPHGAIEIDWRQQLHVAREERSRKSLEVVQQVSLLLRQAAERLQVDPPSQGVWPVRGCAGEPLETLTLLARDAEPIEARRRRHRFEETVFAERALKFHRQMVERSYGAAPLVGSGWDKPHVRSIAAV
jgi:hypothetical protein